MPRKSQPTPKPPPATATMTKQRTNQLEQIVRDTVRNFERATGCRVEGLRLRRTLRFGQTRDEVVAVDAQVTV